MDESTINPDALTRLEDWGGPDLIQQMVRLFLESAPDRIDQIREAFGDDPGSVPERGAHSLKSSAANIGAEFVREVASKMEHAAAKGDLESVRNLFTELESAYDAAKSELERILGRYAE
jgi:HPt (histidine-containing phosphotransfer) domain-containing protein